MNGIKEVFGVLGTLIGILTGLLTLYAKYMDLRKQAARKEAEEQLPAAREPVIELGDLDEVLPAETAAPRPVRMVTASAVGGRLTLPCAARPDAETIARARQRVKAPAIALMGAGVISLLSNVLVAGYGFVDQFVTPLNEESQMRRAAAADPRGEKGKIAAAEETNNVLAVFTLLGFSAGSLGAIWAGYNMLNLRSYWLSVAGSFALMPGACVCCMAGFPIGLWSLFVLVQPDVSASFT